MSPNESIFAQKKRYPQINSGYVTAVVSFNNPGIQRFIPTTAMHRIV